MNEIISTKQDITRTTLAVLFIAVLAAGSFWILHPFITPLLWAGIIVVATWPLMLRVQARLWGRRGLAVTVMTIALLLVFVAPFSAAILAIIDRGDEIVAWFRSLSAIRFPPPPEWVTGIPFTGPRLVERWQELAALRPEELSARLAPYAGKVIGWFVARAGSVGMMLLNFLLTVIIAAILYANGERVAGGLSRLARRLAGRQGEETAVLAAKAVRGVALGVVVTALIQSFLGGIGLAVTGVPATMLLTGVMFLLCVAQLGPGLVLIPSVIWLYWSGETLWGTVLLVWSLFAGTMDNFLRPILIRKGAELPLVLIFAGVIGGLIAFGVIGLFIGPVVLAVTYTLLQAWVAEGGSETGREVQDDE